MVYKGKPGWFRGTPISGNHQLGMSNMTRLPAWMYDQWWCMMMYDLWTCVPATRNALIWPLKLASDPSILILAQEKRSGHLIDATHLSVELLASSYSLWMVHLGQMAVQVGWECHVFVSGHFWLWDSWDYCSFSSCTRHFHCHEGIVFQTCYFCKMD